MPNAATATRRTHSGRGAGTPPRPGPANASAPHRNHPIGGPALTPVRPRVLLTQPPQRGRRTVLRRGAVLGDVPEDLPYVAVLDVVQEADQRLVRVTEGRPGPVEPDAPTREEVRPSAQSGSDQPGGPATSSSRRPTHGRSRRRTRMRRSGVRAVHVCHPAERGLASRTRRPDPRPAAR